MFESKARQVIDEVRRGEDFSLDQDIELLSFYKEGKNVSKVRDKYREKYGPGS